MPYSKAKEKEENKAVFEIKMKEENKAKKQWETKVFKVAVHFK